MLCLGFEGCKMVEQFYSKSSLKVNTFTLGKISILTLKVFRQCCPDDSRPLFGLFTVIFKQQVNKMY